MVVGYNSDPHSDFAIVLLAPLPAGKTIVATDNAWTESYGGTLCGGTWPSTLPSSDSEVTHTATINEPAHHARRFVGSAVLARTPPWRPSM
jgi:hypothetical protein